MSELLDVSTEPVIPAQTVAPDTEPSGWMPLSDEARNTIPENIKGLFEAKKWSSVEDVAKSYTELESVLGKGEHIFKPESPDDADAWGKYWQQLGVPDDVNGYEYEADETVPFEEGVLSRFKEFSKQIHLNKEQSAGLVQFQRDIIKEAMEATAQEEADTVATTEADKEIVRKALVQRCGGEVAYQNQIKEARVLADRIGIFQAAEKLGITKEPEFIGMLMDFAEKVDVEAVLAPSTPAVPIKDPQEELDEIMKSEAFLNRFAPGRKAIMQRYMELNKIIANSGNAPQRPTGG